MNAKVFEAFIKCATRAYDMTPSLSRLEYARESPRGTTGGAGRREIGHGALAEKALAGAIPPEAEFMYGIRVESLITESCGSSSMASVCGGCLALLDAGVPLTRSVAGVAMGVLLSDTLEPVVLTDILGVEDALGSMDFKVRAPRKGTDES